MLAHPRPRPEFGVAEASVGSDDALVCPTTAVPGLPAGDDLLGRLVVNGEDHGEPLWAAMTAPFDISNRCPVLNVPSGHSTWGLPTGVRIVGHTYDDATVFRVGKALEHLRPWAYAPDHRPSVGRRPAA
ncbi:hypothetical protein [Streptomyces hydrogenans]|uniref:hypothetical protein n=1 Tax=Streptomyces hydrogenans TaxID=1873719 RepID=UPI0035DB8D71